MSNQDTKQTGIARLGVLTFFLLLFVSTLSVASIFIKHTALASSGSIFPPGNILNFLHTDPYYANTNQNPVNADSNCQDDLQSARKNYSGRDAVNASQPYRRITWISEQGTPGQPVKVNQGDTSVDLQFNYMEFVCAILTHNNNDSDTITDTSNGPSGEIVRDSNYGTDGNDRKVYMEGDSDNHQVDYVAEFQNRALISNAATDIGSIPKQDSDKILNLSDLPNHRYWYANDQYDFTLKAPKGGFDDGQKITITISYKDLETYHGELGGYNVSKCLSTAALGGAYDSSVDDYYYTWNNNLHDENSDWASHCRILTQPVTFQINVITKVRVNPGGQCAVNGSAIDNNYPNKQLTIDLYDGNTKIDSTTTSGSDANGDGFHPYSFPRSDLGSAVDWGTHAYTVVARGIGSDPDDSEDVDIGPCANLSCGSYTADIGVVNQPGQVQVWMDVDNGTTRPPGNPDFTIKVVGQDPGTNSKTFTGVADQPYSNGKIYSAKVDFTPTGAGDYKVGYSYNGIDCPVGTPSTVGYAPYFSVEGGDIEAGAGFGLGTSCRQDGSDIRSWNTNTGPNYAGAGSEIGALATGDIKDFVSGLNLSPVYGGVSAQSGHGLTLANDGSSGGASITPSGNYYGGSFGAVPCMYSYSQDAQDTTKVAKTTTPSTLASTSSVTGLAQPTAGGSLATSYFYDAVADSANTTHTVTLGNQNAGPSDTNPIVIPAGKTLSLYINGDVYIRQNITYANYTSVDQIPRFNLYVTGNIYINPNVTELHGVYVAQQNSSATSGYLYTCALNSSGTFTESRDYTKCGQQLTFVGSVATRRQLRLDRTDGSLVADNPNGVKAEPAEIFEYSPELWLNGSVNTAGTGSYKAYTSLPPVL